jgi:phosphoribosylamine--glycine ligase
MRNLSRQSGRITLRFELKQIIEDKIMKVLIVGSGGREHALAWKMLQSPLVSQVFVAPGNAGTALEPNVINVPIGVTAIDTLAEFAISHNVDLTVVGPEVPLALGIVDTFKAANLKCLGPSLAASQLEASKFFAKEFLQRYHIPTALYASFTELAPALEYVRLVTTFPVVIKADGLAQGKGVIIARDLTAADAAIRSMFLEQKFGAAGNRIVIEQFLHGEEVSFIALVDNTTVIPLASSQDHKAVGDGDVGPNTGGMGAYSPAPVLTPALHEKVMQKIILPTVHGMAAEGNPYTGFLYAGLMISSDNIPRVLEFNCRLGDPETQVIILRLKSDLAALCLAAVDNKLDQVKVDWDTKMALGVVLTAGGYPGTYNTGDIITGLLQTLPSDNKIFHAGTAIRNEQIVTAGGRVLCVTALGATVAEAQARAYDIVKNIHWHKRYCRWDIGYKAIHRL